MEKINMFMVGELLKRYASKKKEIKSRLQEFLQVKGETDERLFAELSFCLCTPQSKATVCWNAISSLVKNNLLYTGTQEQIKPFLNAIRFNENKSKYIIAAREIFSKGTTLKMKDFLNSFKDQFELREWLVENVKGIGYKESSHFLRNIGMGNELAILDTHILKNLKRYEVIADIPKSLSKKTYLDIETKMRSFAEKIDVPFDELDLLLWAEETGFIFK